MLKEFISRLINKITDDGPNLTALLLSKYPIIQKLPIVSEIMSEALESKTIWHITLNEFPLSWGNKNQPCF